MCSCDEALELISAELDEMLSKEERMRLEEHLALCPECGALATELWTLHEAMPEEEEPPEGFYHEVMARVAAEQVVPFQGKRVGKKRWKTWVSFAAVFAVILLGAGTMNHLGMLTHTRSGEAGSYAAPQTMMAEDTPEPSQNTASTDNNVMGASLPQQEKDATSVEPRDGSAENPSASTRTAMDTPNPTQKEPSTTLFTGQEKAEESGPVNDSALTPLQALDLALERIYGDSGYQREATLMEDEARLGYSVMLYDGETVIDQGEIDYLGHASNGAYYLFAWTWEGQTEEDAALFRYVVPVEGGAVQWLGEMPDGGKSFQETADE